MLCTEPAVNDVEIIERFFGYWPTRESIHDGKQPAGWNRSGAGGRERPSVRASGHVCPDNGHSAS